MRGRKLRGDDPPARSALLTLCSMLLSRILHPSAWASLRLVYITFSRL